MTGVFIDKALGITGIFEKQNRQQMLRSSTFSLANCCQMCYIKDIKGKAIEAATLNNVKLMFYVSRRYCSSGGYFRFPLKTV